MWVECFRLHLPLLGDDTTNRVESSFSLLKESLSDTFITVPKTIEGIQHLVEYADNRLLERYALGRERRLVIFNANKKILALNEEASHVLNDRGCRLLNEALCKMEERRGNIEIVDGGVLETFANGNKKEYNANDRFCNCSFAANHQAPCLHILFLRRLDEISDPETHIFDKTLFNSRYYKRDLMGILCGHENNNEETNDDENNNEHTEVVENEELSSKKEKIMTERSRFKMIMPIALSIANLASLHDTRSFLKIKEDLELVEKRIRRGNRVFPLGAREISDEDTTVDDTEGVGAVFNSPGEEAGNVDSAEDKTAEETEMNDTVPEEDYNPDSRFNSLKFEESVRTKGRPRKKKDRQVIFNKTALDKKKKTDSKQAKNPKPLKRSKFDFIDDSEVFSNDEVEDDDEDEYEDDEEDEDEDSPNASDTDDDTFESD